MTIRIATVAATVAKRRRGVGSNDCADGSSGISNDEETDDENADCQNQKQKSGQSTMPEFSTSIVGNVGEVEKSS